MLISPVGEGAHYFACFLVATGLYVVVGIPLSWLPTNKPRYGARTTASGIQLTIGNSAGIMAPYLYKSADEPRYVLGHAVTMALVAFSGLIYGFMCLYFMHLNKRRRDGREDWKVRTVGTETGGGTGMEKSDDDVLEMGDESPRFLYTI